MKEYRSKTGGRHTYNSDFQNLQELALAMQQMFADYGGNFVISGCVATSNEDGSVDVSEGYVYISGKVRYVEAASNLSPSNLYIVAAERNGSSIPYADGTSYMQYVEYYAETKNTDTTNAGYIQYANSSFPNLSTAFFNNYAVCKKAGAQSIDSLTVQNQFTTNGTFNATNGVVVGQTGTTITRVGSDLVFSINNAKWTFSATGALSMSMNGTTLFSFSNTNGTGTVTYGNVTVQQDLRTKKLYLNGIDIENKFVPLGVINMWAGSVDKIPKGYALCNGQTLEKSKYAALYQTIGTTFNTAPNANGTNYQAPADSMFRLPDLQGRFIVGYNPQDADYNGIKKVGGSKNVLLTGGQCGLQAHSHTATCSSGGEHRHLIKSESGDDGSSGQHELGGGSNGVYTEPAGSHNHSITIASSGAQNATTPHENRPPYYVLAYIMRIE